MAGTATLVIALELVHSTRAPLHGASSGLAAAYALVRAAAPPTGDAADAVALALVASVVGSGAFAAAAGIVLPTVDPGRNPRRRTAGGLPPRAGML